MVLNLFTWKPEENTPEENNRWVVLRAMEWGSYPAFLAPIWGIFITYFYGWSVFLVMLIIITFIWKVFIMKSFISIGLLNFTALLVNILKWLFAVVLAVLSYLSFHNILFSLSLLLFPPITYLSQFLELPYELGGLSKQAQRITEMQNRIYYKLGLKEN